MAKEVYNNLYYDIESLKDIFTLCSFSEKDNTLEVYYLLDSVMNDNQSFDAAQIDLIKSEIYKKNQNFKGEITFYNLHEREANIRLAQTFGCEAPGYIQSEFCFPLVKDIDSDFDESIHPYFMGYNSLNYDQTILSMYFAEVFSQGNLFDSNGNGIGTSQSYRNSGEHHDTDYCDLPGVFMPTTPEIMRGYNDELFNGIFKECMPDRLKCDYVEDNPKDFTLYRINGRTLKDYGWNTENPAYFIRQNQIKSGRHIDVAKLNEKQIKVGLKRLLGMGGYQILESDVDLSDRGQGQNSSTKSLLDFKYNKDFIEYMMNLIPCSNQVTKQQHFLDTSQYISRLNNAQIIPHIRQWILIKIASLIAYNVSDVVNLKNLFHDKNYVATFKLKKQMLLDYPELIFEQQEESYEEKTKQFNPKTKRYDLDAVITKTRKLYKPDIKPDKIKRNRLTINSSSAQLAAACLCPYGKLTDEPVVSFMYPSEKKSKELGIPRVNVLDETEKFINDRLKPRVKSAEGQKIIDDLYRMINMYRQIEGCDFNAEHVEDPDDINNLSDISEKINVPYMGPDGEPSSCYVTFSVGGIHGAEYNLELYKEHVKLFEEEQELFRKVKEKYGTASKLLLVYDEKGKAKKRKTIEIDGIEYNVSQFIASNSTLKAAENGNAKYKSKYEKAKRPELFPIDSKGKEALNKKYVITSFGMSNHEDFTSYYPSMLINMSAFENPGLGYDRYAEIFKQKEDFGKLMKDKSLPQEQRDLYSIMRNGTKLILNSASGAADVTYNTPIRMNNRITAMRIIGQLFTWRIGQAQSLEGARVPSTNTDGLYTVFDEVENAKILEREAEAIHVGIEPEPIFIVSKDANNRWEGEHVSNTGDSLKDIKIIAASGGTLACMNGPNTSKSLAHPAIIDWGLAEFLKFKALQGKLDDYDETIGRYLLEQVAPFVFKDKDTGLADRVMLLRMFQNVISSNPNNGTYNFATKEPVTEQNENTVEPMFLQHYNRVFYVDPEKVPNEYKDKIVYLTAAYIRPNDESDQSNLARKVICDLNNNAEILVKGTAKLKKINGIEITTPCIICNEDLSFTTGIEPSWLNFDYYNSELKSTYTKNWQNDAVERGDDDECEETA